MRARSPRAAGGVVLLALLACPLTVAESFAVFTATTSSPGNVFQARSDLRAPSGTTTAGGTTVAHHVVPGGTYNVHATLGDTGAPASGVAANGVTADVSTVTAGQSAAPLGSGSFTYGGTTHTHRSATLTAASSLPRCSYGYTVTARDNAGNQRSVSGTTMVDRDLATSYNLRVDGPAGGGTYHKSIAAAGDVNGDGRPDVIIGREADDYLGGTNNGVAYVVFGQPAMTTVDLNGTTWNSNGLGFRIVGAASGDEAGASVAGAGDINGDGLADLLVGAPRSDAWQRTDAGSVYVVWGKATTTLVDLAQVNAESGGGYRIIGPQAGSFLGAAVAGAGDVLGDSKPDILMGGYGYSYLADEAGIAVVWAGENRTAQRDLYLAADVDAVADYPIYSRVSFDHFGWTLANVGDVNGDGRPDAVVGADLRGFNGRTEAGSAVVVFGKVTQEPVHLDTLGARGYEIGGAAAGDWASNGVGAAGDVNGDGRADVLVGAFLASPGGRSRAGAAYVVFGKATSGAIDLAALGSNGYRILGATAGDQAGLGVAGIGDVNADGIPDALVGAPGWDWSRGTNSGAAYVVFGQRGTTADIDLATIARKGYLLRGPAANTRIGASVAAGGDLDGDGLSELLVGSTSWDETWSWAGLGQHFVVTAPPCG